MIVTSTTDAKADSTFDQLSDVLILEIGSKNIRGIDAENPQDIGRQRQYPSNKSRDAGKRTP
jgi:hypothetical protein